jgi:hypothetical protein
VYAGQAESFQECRPFCLVFDLELLKMRRTIELDGSSQPTQKAKWDLASGVKSDFTTEACRELAGAAHEEGTVSLAQTVGVEFGTEPVQHGVTMVPAQIRITQQAVRDFDIVGPPWCY